jgi:hypothetical protein
MVVDSCNFILTLPGRLAVQSKLPILFKINFSDVSFVKSGIGGTDFTIRAGHLSAVGWSAGGKVISI